MQQDEVLGREWGLGATPAGEVYLKMAFLICSFGLSFRYVVGIIQSHHLHGCVVMEGIGYTTLKQALLAH